MSEQATERTVVKTYVPAYQKEQWQDHADDLGMSQSEFVRSMVQAGRRGFTDGPTTDDTDTAEEPGSSDATPGVQDLETVILDLLESEAHSFAELRDAVTADLETRLDETLQDLQAAGRIRHSGRHGGYVLTEA